MHNSLVFFNLALLDAEDYSIEYFKNRFKVAVLKEGFFYLPIAL